MKESNGEITIDYENSLETIKNQMGNAEEFKKIDQKFLETEGLPIIGIPKKIEKKKKGFWGGFAAIGLGFL